MSGGYVYEHLRGRDQEPAAWDGTIAEGAAAVTDLVYVLIPAFAPDLQIGPCRWSPRVWPETVNLAEPGETARNVDLAEVVYPQRGDSCLVVFSEAQAPWVVEWWPVTL